MCSSFCARLSAILAVLLNAATNPEAQKISAVPSIDSVYDHEMTTPNVTNSSLGDPDFDDLPVPSLPRLALYVVVPFFAGLLIAIVCASLCYLHKRMEKLEQELAARRTPPPANGHVARQEGDERTPLLQPQYPTEETRADLREEEFTPKPIEQTQKEFLLNVEGGSPGEAGSTLVRLKTNVAI